MTNRATEPDMKAIIDQIDESIERMTGILQAELEKLNASFDDYLRRIQKNETGAETSMLLKLDDARKVFRQAKTDAAAIGELLEPLQNIKEVNKMVRFALQGYEGKAFIKIASYIGSIANICLGQLKYIRARYETVLKTIKEDITRLWMDRELSRVLRLILSVNHLQFNKFLKAFQRAEVLYADISLAIRESKDEDFHQNIVLRMVSNRLPSVEEQRIIQTLFPTWESTES